MSVEEQLIRWENFYEVLFKLYSEVEDIFRSRCWYDDKWQYHEECYEPDEHTPYLMKLSELLSNVINFVKSRVDELNEKFERECNEKRNGEIAFEAWKLSLCPRLMRDVQRYLRPPLYDEFEVFDEVAEYLNDDVISYENTRNAINEWQSARLPKSA